MCLFLFLSLLVKEKREKVFCFEYKYFGFCLDVLRSSVIVNPVKLLNASRYSQTSLQQLKVGSLLSALFLTFDLYVTQLLHS